FRLPPSMPMRTWLRAFVPLVPRPAVLPFDASPRPTRVFAVFAPGAGRRWCIFSTCARAAASGFGLAFDFAGAFDSVFDSAFAAAVFGAAFDSVLVDSDFFAADVADSFFAAAALGAAFDSVAFFAGAFF